MLKKLSSPRIGNHPETHGELPAPSLRPEWKPPSTQQIHAAKMANRLFGMLPPLDVGDPEAFMTATIAIFTEYPLSTVEDAVPVIAQRSDRPTLRLIREVCEDLYAPVARQIARDRIAQERRLALPPPDKPPQARRDEQVAEVRRLFGAPVKKPWIVPDPYGDGRHAERVKADIEQRRLQRESAA